MTSDIKPTLETIALILDNAIRQQILTMGIVRSGRLLSSIQTIVIGEFPDMHLETQMAPYGAELNQRYGFIEAAHLIVQPEIEALLQQAVQVATNEKLNNLLNKF